MRTRPTFRRCAARLVATATIAATATVAHADLYVVVNASNPVREMSHDQVQDLFMGRARSFPGGGTVLPLDQARNGPTRAVFYRLLTGMDMAQVNAHWARLMFSGQGLPPLPLPTEAAVVDVVRHNPAAIGYLDQAPADRTLQVVLVLKE